MPEKRQHLRQSVCAPCPPTVVSLGENGKAIVVDLSEAGMGMVSAKNLEVGLMPQLQFELPGSGTVHATGCVVWSNASGRAGVALSNLLPIIQEGIRDWLAVSALAQAETAPPYPGPPIDSLSDWVTGPLPLKLEVLQHGVREKRNAVYMLGHGNGAFHVMRVGRADDLWEGLVPYIGQYDQFLYAYCTSRQDAFLRECRLYHHHRPRNNNSHPARRPGTSWDCPLCHGYK